MNYKMIKKRLIFREMCSQFGGDDETRTQDLRRDRRLTDLPKDPDSKIHIFFRHQIGVTGHSRRIITSNESEIRKISITFSITNLIYIYVKEGI